MMFALELIGAIMLAALMIALPIAAVCYAYEYSVQKRRDRRTKYYIINKTGNVFREYDDEITRDIDLEGFNNMGFEFRAHNHVYVKLKR